MEKPIDPRILEMYVTGGDEVKADIERVFPELPIQKLMSILLTHLVDHPLTFQYKGIAYTATVVETNKPYNRCL